jgi:hypothetical protein
MEAITPDECLKWLQAHGVPTVQAVYHNELLQNLTSAGFETIKFQLPKESGRKVALARLTFKQFKSDSHVLVWLQNWEVFASTGHKPLLIRLRQAMGCSTELEATPGHIFPLEELADAISILIVSLEFCWDCLVVGTNTNLVFFISHDDFYLIMSSEKQTLSGVQSILESGKWGRKLPWASCG